MKNRALVFLFFFSVFSSYVYAEDDKNINNSDSDVGESKTKAYEKSKIYWEKKKEHIYEVHRKKKVECEKEGKRIDPIKPEILHYKPENFICLRHDELHPHLHKLLFG